MSGLMRYGAKGALNRIKSPKLSLGNTGSFLGTLGSQVQGAAQQAAGQAIGSVAAGVPGASSFMSGIPGLQSPVGASPVTNSVPGLQAPVGASPVTNSVPGLQAAAVPNSSISANLKSKYPNIKCFYYATDGKYYPIENLEKYGPVAQAGGTRRRRRRRKSTVRRRR